MKRAWTIPVVIVALLTVLQPVFAPTFGPFPGLDSLIARSDAIVVAELVRQQKPSPFAGHEEWGVFVRRTLKGGVPEGKMTTLSLRPLPLVTLTRKDLAMARPTLHTGERHVVFLQKRGDPNRPAYASLDYEGGLMQVSPLGDASMLERDTARETIVALLRDYLAYKTRQLRQLEGQIKTILGEAEDVGAF